ncbi:ABC transporter auxiliary component [Legionella wadsworthii]|uniref:ABC transporter auxiliary component n=1 Tax=Legionella wadsworthii TaxID=28088 RepID=A0A378LSN7_9GAMM|nr:ABC-type transport auxiliary lipoprotein family protein [Legionella wadsworthii]STY29793.1 ABC transporter auxiliary component [Legionella wadsworthii]
MKKLTVLMVLGLCTVMLSACSPVKISVKNQYQLSAYSTKKVSKIPMPITLLVTAPDAAAGYQTDQMLYIKKPFELEPFVKNAWVNSPADMLYPLIIQSLQSTNLFKAVTSNAYTLGANYRLDTQLLALQQNFLKKPSVLEFSVKVVLTHVSDNKVLGSKIFNLKIPCPSDTPYGGVIAANKATQIFTGDLAIFVVSHIGHEQDT